MRFIYVFKRQVKFSKKSVISNLSPLFFADRDNAEKVFAEWKLKMKDADYIDGFSGYIETAELEDV